MRFVLAILIAGCGARTALEVEPLDAQAPDASVSLDAGLDAGPDAARPDCISDLDCDDGLDCTRDTCAAGRCAHTGDDARCDDRLFCTGIETCDLVQGCVSRGSPCDDGVACTDDRCIEATRRCAAVPDASRCPISHRCDPVRGCIARALVHDTARLYEVDLPDGAITPGPPVRGLTDVALHPDGTLFAVDGGTILRVDPASGATEPVFPTMAFLVALEVGPDGALYAAGEQGVLRIDLSTGRIAPFGSLPPNRWVSGDIAFVRGTMLVTARRSRFGTTEDDLVAIDGAGGVGRVLGPTSVECIWGLAPFGDTLYGFTCRAQLVLLDPRNGAGRVIASLGGLEIGGAAAR
ncbi:MAG: hypothetical protein IT378_22585 [Sandaracinaceae bacterium]|nr:hypothetical protein [Sandaracinaceae bacterium]